MGFHFKSPILDLFHGFSVVLPPGLCLTNPFTPYNPQPETPPPPTLESPHVYKSFMPMSHIRLYIFIQDESGSVYSQFTSCLDRNCETADQFLFYSVANLETFSRELELNMKLTEPFRY